MASHRYWRLLNLTVNGGAYATIAELEMFETPGGANVCVGGTPSASSEFSGWPASAAFDGIKTANAGWSTLVNQQNNSWIKYDFGPSGARDIKQFSITSVQTGLDQTPKDFYFQYSDDNVNWYTVSIGTGQTGWGVNQTRTFNVFEWFTFSLARPYSLEASLPRTKSPAKNMFMVGGEGAFSGAARTDQGGVPNAQVRAFEINTGLIAAETYTNSIGEWTLHNLNPNLDYFLVCAHPESGWEQVISSYRTPYIANIYLNLRRTFRTGEAADIEITTS